MARNLERDVRLLQAYAVVMTLVVVGVFVTGVHLPNQRVRIGELDVERINLIEKNGKLDLVMANRDRAPDPIVDGRAMKSREDHDPGMFFYNDKGDENGGMGFAGGKTRDGYAADAALMFDQYREDETVGLVYNDVNGQREAGLKVWDRPDFPVTVLGDRAAAIQAMPSGPAREAAMGKLQAESKAGAYGSTRLFAGKLPDKSAGLVVSDAAGKPRLSILVDAKGKPSIRFLDDAGRVAYQLPAKR